MPFIPVPVFLSMLLRPPGWNLLGWPKPCETKDTVTVCFETLSWDNKSFTPSNAVVEQLAHHVLQWND